MEKLREEIVQLERSYKLVHHQLREFYKARKEHYIKEYIKK